MILTFRCPGTTKLKEKIIKCKNVIILTVFITLIIVGISSSFKGKFQVGTENDQFLIPSDDQLEQLSDLELLDVFTKYTNSFQIMCRNHKRVGTLWDGGKEICADVVIRPRSPCLVYSFGKGNEEEPYDPVRVVEPNGRQYLINFVKDSNNQFDFEDKVIKYFGCQVLTLDPTMGHLNASEMKVPNGCQFYPKGLDGTDIPSKKLYTMGTILKEFHHTEKILDILKMDIEDSEWSALDEMMTSGVLKNVRQLLVEFHFHELSKPEKIRRLGVFRRLYEYGFRTFSRERNIGKSKFVQELGYMVAYFVEISFVNLRFL